MVIRFLLSAFLLVPLLLPISSPKADDSPTQWVGRVSAVEGSLSIRTGDGEWGDSAVINDPIAAGMSVRTGPQSRATLRIGPETIALAAGTELTLGQLDSSGTQLNLRQGRIGIQLAPLEAGHSIEVDSPRGGVWVLTSGTYDILAGDGRSETRVAVLDGRVRIVGKGLDRVVTTGSAVALSGAEAVTAAPEGAGSDEFSASWHAGGGTDEDAAPLGYVSPEMTGYEALEASGSWKTVDGYGAVWFPKDVADDWVPYRNGHWRWVAPWGWTWIDDTAWGFATSHYGRWAQFGPDDGEPRRWGWVPGKTRPHLAYMPAAVAFMGTAGVGLSYPDAFSPAVAWFPLAPDEPYWPAYTKDLDGIRALNAGSGADLDNVTNVEDGELPDLVLRGEYRNRRFLTAVPRAVFLAGKPVAAAVVQIPEQRAKDAPILAGSPQLAPAPQATTMAGAVARSVTGAVRAVTHALAPARALAAARAATLVQSAAVRSAGVRSAGSHAMQTVAAKQQAPRAAVRLSTPRPTVAVSRGPQPRVHLAAAARRGK